jgi:hypothetical protein
MAEPLDNSCVVQQDSKEILEMTAQVVLRRNREYKNQKVILVFKLQDLMVRQVLQGSEGIDALTGAKGDAGTTEFLKGIQS